MRALRIMLALVGILLLAVPASSPAASSITDRLTPDRTAVEVVSLPAGTDHVGVAEATAEAGGTVKHGITIPAKVGARYTPQTPGYPYVGMVADNAKGEPVGAWAPRLKTVPGGESRVAKLEAERATAEAKARALTAQITALQTELVGVTALVDRLTGEIERAVEEAREEEAHEPPVEEPPAEEPPLEEQPHEEVPGPSFLGGLNAGYWGTSEPADVASIGKPGATLVRLDTPPKLTPWETAGLKVIADEAGPYSSAGVSGLNHAAYVQKVVAFVRENPHVFAIEVLNEPGGSWFWGPNSESAANRSSYAQLIIEVHKALLETFGPARPLELCSYDGGHDSSNAWGEAWAKNTTALGDCDMLTEHPYGGHGSTALTGNRRQVEAAHSQTGKLIADTEYGITTGPSTGDSEHVSEQQQGATDAGFIRWARSTGYQPVVTLYGYRDGADGGGYGLETHAGQKKAGWAAVKAALAE